jgi:AcrR family transcriptional regulator
MTHDLCIDKHRQGEKRRCAIAIYRSICMPLTPRKSPIQSRSSHTVDIILEAAARILEQQGIGAYTTNSIARHAGVSVGSLYQYFPHKDAVTAALIGRESSRLLNSIRAASDIEDWQAALKSMIYVALAHHRTRPRLIHMLEVEARRLAIRRQRMRMLIEIRNAVTMVLRKREGSEHTHAESSAWALLTVVRTLCRVYEHRHEVTLDELERRVNRAVFNYLQ